MPAIIMYLIKLSVSLSFVYLFYQFVLRRLTFYNANRWYLLGYSLLSFFIPFINIEPLVEIKTFNEMQVINYIPVIENNVVINKNYLQPNANDFTLNYWDIVLIILAIGSLIMVIRLLIQFLSLQKIKRKAIVINNADTIVYYVDENIIPFSFGNAIYINQSLHSEKEMENIILHEYVHVKQKHTFDILFAEFICIINWYNPFAWLIRHSIRQNLEFIADNDVLKKGLEKKAYQYHLLKVVGTPQYRIANSFNFSSLKKRIAMMNKLKSAKLHLVKFLFMLPLIAVLLVAFRDKYEGIFKNHKGDIIINEVGIIIDLSAKQPIAGVSVKDTVSGLTTTSDKYGFYTLKILIKTDTGRIFLKFSKAGFENNMRGSVFSVSKLQPHGQINVVHMKPRSVDPLTFFDFPYFGKSPNEPTYEDALEALKKTDQQNADLELKMKLEKDHPEVSLFFTSEYKKYQIVVYKNGDVEKYGYPNGPAINDMEKKFGKLPDMMTKSESPIPTEYLNKWENIAANAEKNFHTDNPDVYKIIFPGDSRVIAVPKNGKAKIYDMDNAVPEERMLFEKLYGSLTNIVPPPASNINGFNSGTAYKDWMIDGIQFLGFQSVVINREYSATHFVGNGVLKINPSLAKGLIICNNKEYSAASFYKQFGNTDHKFNDVIIYENKSAFYKFGDKARNGVIVIGSDAKEISYKKADTVPENNNLQNAPAFGIKPMPNALYVVDGVQMPEGWTLQNSSLKPGDIYRIGVLKNDSVLKLSNGKARNILITIITKKQEELLIKTDTIPFSAKKQINISQNKLEEKKQKLLRDFEREHLLIDDSLRIWNSTSNFLSDEQIEALIIERENIVSQLKTDMKNLDPEIDKDDWMRKKIEGEELQNRLYRRSYALYHSLNSKTSYQNKKNNEYPIRGKAEKIILDKKGVEIIGGSLTMEDEQTFLAKGSIIINNEKGNFPLIVYNNQKINRSNNFKTIDGNYKLISLNQKEAFEKYGNSGTDGAIEISSQ